MISNMKEYKLFKEKLRKVKIESFEELEAVLKENAEIKERLIKLEGIKTAQLERQKDKYEAQIRKLKNGHEQELMSLKHAINLEKERIQTKTAQEIEKVEHEFRLKGKEFEKEKEAILLKVKQEIEKEKAEFRDENFKALKDDANTAFDRGIQAVSIFLDKIQYKNKQINAPTESVDVEVTEG